MLLQLLPLLLLLRMRLLLLPLLLTLLLLPLLLLPLLLSLSLCPDRILWRTAPILAATAPNHEAHYITRLETHDGCSSCD